MSWLKASSLVFAVSILAVAFAGAAAQNGKGNGNGGKGDAAKGKELFEANCALCHNADSTEEKVGPGLKGISKKGPDKLSDGTEHKNHSAAVLRKQVVEGGGTMPPVGGTLSDKDVDDVIAYVLTL